jgi:hypothetical protein
MINTTDLSECEVTLPGDWKRTDNGDLYSFTVDHMEVLDERLFKQLIIRHAPSSKEEELKYALSIKDEFCSVIVGGEEFIIKEIIKTDNGKDSMQWEDSLGNTIPFKRM